MKINKKFIPILLAGSIVLTSFSGCKKEEKIQTTETIENVDETQKVQENPVNIQKAQEILTFNGIEETLTATCNFLAANEFGWNYPEEVIELINNKYYLDKDLYEALSSINQIVTEYLNDGRAFSEQLKDKGVNVPENLKGKIDDLLPILFKSYADYVESYNKDDAKGAIRAAKIIEEVSEKLSLNDFYELTVKPVISSIQSNEVTDDHWQPSFILEGDTKVTKLPVMEMSTDSSKNHFEFNVFYFKKLEAMIVMSDPTWDTRFTQINNQHNIDFLKSIPAMLTHQYVYIENTSENADKNEYYVASKSEINDLISSKLTEIKISSQIFYPEINPSIHKIRKIDGIWYIVNKDEEAIGVVMDSETNDLNDIAEIQRAMNNGKGNIEKITEILIKLHESKYVDEESRSR